MAGRLSYFAEKRERENNPNFFNQCNISEIRKNVKRIIRDIKYGVIQEQDYTYFMNERILSACLHEANDQYVAATILVNALNYYINNGLNSGYKPYPNSNTIKERLDASEQQKLQNSRSYTWLNIYRMFEAIYYGAEIKSTLKPIEGISDKDIANL
jgi:hypothetical protein